MKVRSGFVSNSSTTSFAIVGTLIDRDQLDKVYDLDEKFPEISYYYNDYSDVYVGLSMHKMGLDETLREFMHRSREIIQTVFPDEEVGILTDGWYDG